MTHGLIKLLRKISIFQRLVLAFLVLVLLPTVFITFFTYNKYVNEIERNMENFLSLLVQNVNVQITEKLSSMERFAIKFYGDSTISALLEHHLPVSGEDPQPEDLKDHAIIGKRLYAMARQNEYIANMQVITPHTQYTMTDEHGERSGSYVRDLQAFRNSRLYIDALNQHGYPVWFDTTKDPNNFYKNETAKFGLTEVMTMTQALYTMETRQFLGVLVLNIKIGYLTDSLKGYSFYGSGNTFLYGNSGTIMGINSQLTAPNLSQIPGFGEILRRGQEGSYSGEINGQNVFLVYKQVPYTDLFVVHIVDKDQLLEPAYRIRNLCLTIVAVLMMASLAVLYLTTISISKPLGKLMKSMQAFSKDNFNVTYQVTGNDEITVVGKKFNEMVVNTQQLIEQIYISEIKQKTQELSTSKAELNALQMQINPHFLYNTMDIIRWEALYEAGGESKVSRMIEDFCRLMRMAVAKGADLTSIQKELEHAMAYIGVINFRHRDKINLAIDFDFDTAAYHIPKFTLQPLMENAVIHAFNETFSGAEIRISGFIDEGEIRIIVSDNGQGLIPEQLEHLRKSLNGEEEARKGIALNNVNQRLKLHYGEEYGLNIDAIAGSGTSVELRLPHNQPCENYIQRRGASDV